MEWRQVIAVGMLLKVFGVEEGKRMRLGRQDFEALVNYGSEGSAWLYLATFLQIKSGSVLNPVKVSLERSSERVAIKL